MNQLCMASAVRESCSLDNALWSARLNNSQLEFEISDSRIQEIGSYETHIDT